MSILNKLENSIISKTQIRWKWLSNVEAACNEFFIVSSSPPARFFGHVKGHLMGLIGLRYRTSAKCPGLLLCVDNAHPFQALYSFRLQRGLGALRFLSSTLGPLAHLWGITGVLKYPNPLYTTLKVNCQPSRYGDGNMMVLAYETQMRIITSQE
ncbi:clathrin heavy chain [Echinococcus multilocularis]|uniref:Clathrin heavy chain n=1 Tax=Echinococcus multilocularis TaxID=6211 RepID=A0A0S4MMT1_ECHMU|nr:clathrin heavy chain [Echinococcus multilocularis]